MSEERKNGLSALISLWFPLLLVAFALAQCKSRDSNDNRIVLTINTEPVSQAEVAHVMSALRPDVFSYFSQTYGAQDGPEFWNTSFEDEVPSEILRHRTFERLKRIKVQQILMRHYGIVKDISYAGFLASLEKENTRRKEALMKNIPVYGPKDLQAEVYYEYLLSERTAKLKSLLSTREFLIREKDLKRFFNNRRSARYKKSDCLKIERVVYRKEGENGDTLNRRAEVLRAMNKIKKRIQSGEESRIVIKDFQSKASSGLVYEEHVLDGSNLREQASLYSEIETHVQDLKVGKISEIFAGKEGLSFIRIAAIERGLYKSYRDVEAEVYRDLINFKYEELIGRLVDGAVIDVIENIEM